MIFVTIGLLFLAVAYACHWIAGAVLSLIFILCILLPIDGFEERENTEEMELLKLRRGSKKQSYYLEMLDKNNVIFAYDNSDMYDLEGIAYEEGYRKGKIKIYETEFCEEPVLKTFVTKPTRGVFTFAPFSTKREYVFYVPEGTVIRAKDKQHSTTDSDVV